MDFNQLRDEIVKQRYSLTAFAEKLEMSGHGFQSSLRNGTLSAAKLEQACKILQVSPLQFFDLSNSHEVNEGAAPYFTPEYVELLEENRRLRKELEEARK